jgi:DNA-binding MarR family transcriptional regulator
MSKQFKGLWIPAEVLCDKDLKHVEKLVLSMALAMRDGIRMSDATIADQIGVSDRSIAGILKSLVSKGYMGKSGNGYHRKFTALRKVAMLTTQGYVETTQGDVVTTQGCAETTQGCDVVEDESKDIRKAATPLRKVATLTTQGCDHKEYKEYKRKEQSATKVEKQFDEALELDSANTSEVPSLGTKPSWIGLEDMSGYALRNEPKDGTLIRNPHTGTITEYEK